MSLQKTSKAVSIDVEDIKKGSRLLIATERLQLYLDHHGLSTGRDLLTAEVKRMV